MEFKKFHSIENSYRGQFIERFYNRYDMDGEKFAMLEKIHGSNIQIMIDGKNGGKVTRCSRNNVLDDDVDFQGGLNYSMNNLDLDDIIQSATTAKSQIRLFGELFGKGIQKGVDYFDDKRIMFFEVHCDDEILTYEQLKLFLRNFNLPMVPIVGENLTLNQCLEFDVDKFQSIVNTNIEEENIAEGVVILPMYAHLIVGYNRFVLKQKSSKHSEKQKKPKVREVDPIVEEWKNKLLEYVNENRMQNLFSKIGVISDPKDIGKYISAFMKDVMEDFNKDYPEFKELDISKNQRKAINKIQSQVVKILQKYM